MPLLQGVLNFRPVVGIPGGRLYRSGQLGHATAQDEAIICALRLDAVVDLRRPEERRKAPLPPHALADRTVYSDLGIGAEPPHLALLRTGDLSRRAVDGYWEAYYRQAPFEPGNRQLFSALLSRLRVARRPVLVHCTAGKDRTGIAAAIVQRALCVPIDDVLSDYVASNALLDDPSVRSRGEAEIAALLGQQPSPALVRSMLGVSPDRLVAAFAAIEEQAGSMEGYLEWLGQPMENVRALRRALAGA